MPRMMVEAGDGENLMDPAVWQRGFTRAGQGLICDACAAVVQVAPLAAAKHRD